MQVHVVRLLQFQTFLFAENLEFVKDYLLKLPLTSQTLVEHMK